jgi:hypothetical protein
VLEGRGVADFVNDLAQGPGASKDLAAISQMFFEESTAPIVDMFLSSAEGRAAYVTIGAAMKAEGLHLAPTAHVHFGLIRATAIEEIKNENFASGDAATVNHCMDAVIAKLGVVSERVKALQGDLERLPDQDMVIDMNRVAPACLERNLERLWDQLNADAAAAAELEQVMARARTEADQGRKLPGRKPKDPRAALARHMSW